MLEFSMTTLGKKYGVSDNAVKKWCKKYGILLIDRKRYSAKLYAKNKIK